jgi:hypothetical protein
VTLVDERPKVIGWEHKYPTVGCSDKHEDHAAEPDPYSLEIGTPWCVQCGHTLQPKFE